MHEYRVFSIICLCGLWSFDGGGSAFGFLARKSMLRRLDVQQSSNFKFRATKDNEICARAEEEALRFQVYVEDTDAYGVVYYANYAAFYERALQSLLDSPVVIVELTEMCYGAPAFLGSSCVVEAKQKTTSSDWSTTNVNDKYKDSVFTFDMKVKDSISEGTIFNSATVTALKVADAVNGGQSASAESLSGIYKPAPALTDHSSHAFSIPITRYQEDYDYTSSIYHHLPIHVALKYMERCRSESLGSSDVLMQYLKGGEDLGYPNGFKIFVSRIDHCRQISSIPTASLSSSISEEGLAASYSSYSSVYGDKGLRYRSSMDFDRSGRLRLICKQVVQCSHTSSSHSSSRSENGIEWTTLATADVTLVAVDAKTSRPIPFPFDLIGKNLA